MYCRWADAVGRWCLSLNTGAGEAGWLYTYIHPYVGGRCVRCGISSDRPVRTNNSHISAVGRCDERCWPILHEIRQPTLASHPPSGVPKRHRFSYCWWSTCASAPGRSANLCPPKSCWWTFHLSVSTLGLYGRSLLFSSLYIINIVIVYNDIQSRSGPITARQTRAVDGQSN